MLYALFCLDLVSEIQYSAIQIRMELHFTDAVMEDGTSGCTGRWQLPWNGWGEVLLEDCTSFTLGDEVCEDLPTADTSLKVDCTSSDHFAGVDDDVCITTEFFDGGFGFTADMGFTGIIS